MYGRAWASARDGCGRVPSDEYICLRGTSCVWLCEGVRVSECVSEGDWTVAGSELVGARECTWEGGWEEDTRDENYRLGQFSGS